MLDFKANDKNAIKFNSMDLAVNNNLHWDGREIFRSLEGKQGRNTGGLLVGAKYSKATSKEPLGMVHQPFLHGAVEEEMNVSTA